MYEIPAYLVWGFLESGKSTLIQHLNGLLRATSGAIYYDGENQHEILKQLATSEIVIATRFHAVVLGLVSQCRVLPVLYSNKTKNILKDLNINGNMADIKEYMEDHYSFEYSKKLLYDNPKKIFEGKKIIQK